MTDLTTGNIYKKFLLFGLPMVFSGLLSQAYGIVDTMIAGRYLGDNGLAAVGATSQVVSLISSVFWGFNSGFAIYIACLFGSREFSKLRKDIYSVTFVLAIIEIAISVAAVIFSDGILNLIKVAPEIRNDAKIYFCIYILGITPITFNNTFSKLMNSLGVSGYPFYMSLIAGIMNIIGNTLSVTVFRFGVAGIALSSVLASIAVDVCYILKLNGCFKEMGVFGEKISLKFKTFVFVLKFTLPSCLQQISMYIASVTMAPIINAIGSEATAGYSIAMRIYDINAGVYQNSSSTVSNYGAQCAGAKKYDKIRKGLFVGLFQGLLFVLPFIVVSVVFAEKINAIFFPNGFSGPALDYAITFSKYFLPFILFNLINNLFHSFFRGIGTMRLLLISTVVGSVFRIFFGIILGKAYGMNGVYIGWVISWIGEAVYMFIIYMLKFSSTEKIKRAAIKNLG